MKTQPYTQPKGLLTGGCEASATSKNQSVGHVPFFENRLPHGHCVRQILMPVSNCKMDSGVTA